MVNNLELFEETFSNMPDNDKKADDILTFLKSNDDLNFEKSLTLANMAKDISEKIHYENGLAQSYFEIGTLYYSKSRYDIALVNMLQADKHFSNTADISSRTTAKHYSSMLYSFLGRYEESINYALDTIKLAKQIDSSIEGGALINIGEIYRELQRYEDALEFYKKALTFYLGIKCRVNQCIAHCNISLTYHKLNQFDKALEHAKLSLEAAIAGDYTDGQALAYNCFANVYSAQGSITLALDYYEKTLKILNQSDNLFFLLEFYIDFATHYISNSQLSNAVDCLFAAQDYAEKVDAKRKSSIIHKMLAEICEKEFKFEKAIYHYKEHYDIEKNIITNGLEQQMSLANNQFKIEKAEAEAEIYRLKNVELKNKAEELAILNTNLSNEIEARKKLQDEIEEANLNLSNLLNNAGQGFLSFGKELIVDNEYSTECEKMLGGNISGKHFAQLLFSSLTDEDKAISTRVLNDLFEKHLNKESGKVYLTLLPHEVHINNLYIKLEYKFLTNISTPKIMVIMTDITEKREMERKILEETSKMNMILKVVMYQDEIVKLLSQYEKFFSKEVHDIFFSTSDKHDSVQKIYRMVHTFKGSFSQFNMNHTADNLHYLESHISTYFSSNSPTWFEDVISIFSGLDLNEMIYEDISVINAYLNEDFLKVHDNITINKQTILELDERLKTILMPKDYDLVIPEIKRLGYKSFKELLRHYPAYIEMLFDQNGKPLHKVKISGDEVLVDSEKYYNFTNSLIHVFRNIAEHGIESFEKRCESGKSEEGTIEINILKSDDTFSLTIKDDGQGIDFSKIRHKALEKNIYTHEEIDSIADSDLINLIFKDSFSTKDEVTLLSGRGVGLSAVKQATEEIGGIISVNTQKNVGTEFKFTFHI